jgi:hypothetical protein
MYRTIIFSVVLYGRETWYLILREEHRLKVLITGAVWAEEEQSSRGLKELQREERPDFHCLTNIVVVIKSRKMR